MRWWQTTFFGRKSAIESLFHADSGIFGWSWKRLEQNGTQSIFEWDEYCIVWVQRNASVDMQHFESQKLLTIWSLGWKSEIISWFHKSGRSSDFTQLMILWSDNWWIFGFAGYQITMTWNVFIVYWSFFGMFDTSINIEYVDESGGERFFRVSWKIVVISKRHRVSRDTTAS